MLHAAVMTAVGKVHNKTDYQPDDQTRPVQPAQFVHHVTADHDAEDWHDWNPRRAEWAMLRGITFPQNHDCYTHDHERQKRSDIYHLADVVNRHRATDDRCQQADQDRVLPRRPEL